MRRTTRSAAVLVASVAVVAGMTQAPAQAFTKKELKICWKNDTGSPAIDFSPVADGPSFRTTHLADGECEAWDVRPGTYKITLQDANTFLSDSLGATCGPGLDPSFRVRVKRQGKEYKDYSLNTLLNGNLITSVRNNRSTSIAARLQCL